LSVSNEGVEEEARAADPKPGYARLILNTPVRAYPAVGDGKATALLSAYGLIISVLLSFSGPLGAMTRGADPFKAGLATVILAPLTVLLFLGMWHSIRALFLPVPPMPANLMYYQHVAATSREEYVDAMRGLRFQEGLRQLMYHNYALSTLCTAKFRLVETGVACLRASFALWLLLLLIVTLGGR